MFVCLNCGKIFCNTKRYTETHNLDTPPYEDWEGCPICGGAYTKTYECDECRHWITGKYIKTDSGQRVCENCYITYELGEED